MIEFVRTIPGYDHLWAVKYPEKETDDRAKELTREKARKLESNPARKLGLELDKLNKCKEFLKANGVFDQDSFIEYIHDKP